MIIIIKWSSGMLFKDWRQCDQSPVLMNLDKSRFYYIQSRAWALKGYLGGTHSYCAFWDQQWLVVELTERETLEYQDGRILYDGNVTPDDTVHAPYITTRSYNSKWFGSTPYIVDSCVSTVDYHSVLSACKQYPLTEFKLLYQNCNTFTSFLISKLNLPLSRPLRSVGFRNKKWWKHD